MCVGLSRFVSATVYITANTGRLATGVSTDLAAFSDWYQRPTAGSLLSAGRDLLPLDHNTTRAISDALLATPPLTPLRNKGNLAWADLGRRQPNQSLKVHWVKNKGVRSQFVLASVGSDPVFGCRGLESYVNALNRRRNDGI